ncbi:MAG: DUF4242 domain-containing protein [Acidimicrobiia bacterium]|nr:DUF4242 domain-containing protein [Acidimicrobiia bacterium]
MPKFVIERPLPGAGNLSPADLQGIAQKSVDVLRELGPDVQWAHSYVTDDAIVCVYNAANPEIIREHARCGGFPCDTVREVRHVIDPVTAEV